MLVGGELTGWRRNVQVSVLGCGMGSILTFILLLSFANEKLVYCTPTLVTFFFKYLVQAPERW